MYSGYLWTIGKQGLTGSSRLRPQMHRPAGMTPPAIQNGEQDAHYTSSPPVADRGDLVPKSGMMAQTPNETP
jgi:hypothetical protein